MAAGIRSPLVVSPLTPEISGRRSGWFSCCNYPPKRGAITTPWASAYKLNEPRKYLEGAHFFEEKINRKIQGVQRKTKSYTFPLWFKEK
jgi:hypothetical protein